MTILPIQDQENIILSFKEDYYRLVKSNKRNCTTRQDEALKLIEQIMMVIKFDNFFEKESINTLYDIIKMTKQKIKSH